MSDWKHSGRVGLDCYCKSQMRDKNEVQAMVLFSLYNWSLFLITGFKRTKENTKVMPISTLNMKRPTFQPWASPTAPHLWTHQDQVQPSPKTNAWASVGPENHHPPAKNQPTPYSSPLSLLFHLESTVGLTLATSTWQALMHSSKPSPTVTWQRLQAGPFPESPQC